MARPYPNLREENDPLRVVSNGNFKENDQRDASERDGLTG